MSRKEQRHLVIEEKTEWFLEDDEEIRIQLKDNIEYKLVLTHVEPLGDTDYFYVYEFIYVPGDWGEKEINAAILRNKIDGTRVFH